jgi:hypothetical protein
MQAEKCSKFKQNDKNAHNRPGFKINTDDRRYKAGTATQRNIAGIYL